MATKKIAAELELLTKDAQKAISAMCKHWKRHGAEEGQPCGAPRGEVRPLATLLFHFCFYLGTEENLHTGIPLNDKGNIEGIDKGLMLSNR